MDKIAILPVPRTPHDLLRETINQIISEPRCYTQVAWHRISDGVGMVPDETANGLLCEERMVAVHACGTSHCLAGWMQNFICGRILTDHAGCVPLDMIDPEWQEVLRGTDAVDYEPIYPNPSSCVSVPTESVVSPVRMVAVLLDIPTKLADWLTDSDRSFGYIYAFAEAYTQPGGLPDEWQAGTCYRDFRLLAEERSLIPSPDAAPLL
jgi:hypothetical protein